MPDIERVTLFSEDLNGHVELTGSVILLYITINHGVMYNYYYDIVD